MDDKKIILDVKNLTKIYKKRIAVNNVTFNSYEGEILGFLGPNGAGKTTTIKMITGLIKKDSGSVSILGNDIDSSFEDAMKNVGAIVETPYFYENMSGYDNLSIFAKAKGAGPRQISEIIDFIDLGNRIKDKVKTYSLGMKQRLGIGIALLSNPKLLILDEPTNGLDPVGIKELRDFLKDLAHINNICIFVSSHMLWEMEKLCDRVIIISDGNMIGEADINEILKKNISLEDYYISLVKS